MHRPRLTEFGCGTGSNQSCKYAERLSGFHWRWGNPSKRLISSLNTDHRSCPIANKNCVLLCRSNRVLSRIRVLIILIVRINPVKYELIFDKVVRRFCCSFLCSSSSLYLSCHRKPWSQRSWKQWEHFPFSSLSKLEQFFFVCCFAACRHGEIVDRVLPLEGIGKFSKCLYFLPAFSWPFLDRTNFTVWCCSFPWGLRGCDSLHLVVSFLISMLRLVHSDST